MPQIPKNLDTAQGFTDGVDGAKALSDQQPKTHLEIVRQFGGTDFTEKNGIKSIDLAARLGAGERAEMTYEEGEGYTVDRALQGRTGRRVAMANSGVEQEPEEPDSVWAHTTLYTQDRHGNDRVRESKNPTVANMVARSVLKAAATRGDTKV